MLIAYPLGILYNPDPSKKFAVSCRYECINGEWPYPGVSVQWDADEGAIEPLEVTMGVMEWKATFPAVEGVRIFLYDVGHVRDQDEFNITLNGATFPFKVRSIRAALSTPNDVAFLIEEDD